MKAIESIIEALGYSNSKNLYYSKNQNDQLNSNYSLKKIIEALDPVAYYCLEDKPFMLFFECSESNLSAELNRKIWNAQIPISVIVFENRIEIFNGCSLNKENELILLETIGEINQLSETSSFSYWNLSSATFWERHTGNLTAAKLDAVMLEHFRYNFDF